MPPATCHRRPAGFPPNWVPFVFVRITDHIVIVSTRILTRIGPVVDLLCFFLADAVGVGWMQGKADQDGRDFIMYVGRAPTRQMQALG